MPGEAEFLVVAGSSLSHGASEKHRAGRDPVTIRIEGDTMAQRKDDAYYTPQQDDSSNSRTVNPGNISQNLAKQEALREFGRREVAGHMDRFNRLAKGYGPKGV